MAAVQIKGGNTVQIKGGNKLREYLRSVADKLRPMTLKVGFLENATYPDGKQVAMIAAIQEFGVPLERNDQPKPEGEALWRIPPRPFFRNMIAEHQDEWPEGFATQLKETNYDVRATFDRAGQAIAGQLKQSIIDTNEPPLAPSTIKRKGFAKPLIDTSVMINSVDYEVSEK